MDTQWFNVIGLVLDITGVVLLFMYGLPSEFKRENGDFSKGGSGKISDKELKSNKSYNWRLRFFSKFGLALLIIGFILQILSSIANIYPECNC